MTEMHEIELWVVVDESGDYGIGKDQDECDEDYNANIGGSSAKRVIRITLSVPAPEPITLTGTVPAESSKGATLKVG